LPFYSLPCSILSAEVVRNNAVVSVCDLCRVVEIHVRHSR